MTDQDVVNNVANITGLGSVHTLPRRTEKHKDAYRWSIGSSDAVEFLNSIMPWLGARRSARAQEAIDNWTTNKRQSSKTDSECVNGHAYDATNNKRTKYGTCHLCNLEASRRYREKFKKEREEPSLGQTAR